MRRGAPGHLRGVSGEFSHPCPRKWTRALRVRPRPCRFPSTLTSSVSPRPPSHTSVASTTKDAPTLDRPDKRSYVYPTARVEYVTTLSVQVGRRTCTTHGLPTVGGALTNNYSGHSQTRLFYCGNWRLQGSLELRRTGGQGPLSVLPLASVKLVATCPVGTQRFFAGGRSWSREARKGRGRGSHLGSPFGPVREQGFSPGVQPCTRAWFCVAGRRARPVSVRRPLRFRGRGGTRGGRRFCPRLHADRVSNGGPVLGLEPWVDGGGDGLPSSSSREGPCGVTRSDEGLDGRCGGGPSGGSGLGEEGVECRP